MGLNKVEIRVVFGLVVVALLTRLLPHPPNFAPITSIALFTGFHLVNKRLALFIPLICMFLTDLILGVHSLMPIIYLSFVLISMIGLKAKSLSSNETVSNFLFLLRVILVGGVIWIANNVKIKF